MRVHASSGTTGKPTVVGTHRRRHRHLGHRDGPLVVRRRGRPGDLLHNAYGYGLFTGGLGAHYGGEKLGCTVVPFGGGQTERQIQLITDFEPRLITVTPSYCLNLIEEMERLGIDPAATSLQVGIFGPNPDRRHAYRDRRATPDRAVDIYGLSSHRPWRRPGCRRTRTASPSGRTTYPEIIDPETGDVLPDGEGQLVISPRSGAPRHQIPNSRHHPLLPGTAPCGASPGSPAAATTC